MKTLVVHVGGVGDLLLTAPALAKLSQEGPLEIAGHRDRLDLLVKAGIASTAHDLDAAGFDSVFTTPSPRLHAFLEGFDRAIVWMRDDGAIAKAFQACGIDDVRCFSGLPAGNGTRHAAAYYLECLGYASDDASFRLNIPAATTTHDVIIHPGSGSRLKNWPMDRFAVVADSLEHAGRRVEWCHGPAEEGRRIPSHARKLAAMSLVDLAAHLAATRLYLGNDSGITHLAAAVGCPVLAVFGATDPRVWAPVGEHVVVVQGDPWPDVSIVLERICAT